MKNLIFSFILLFSIQNAFSKMSQEDAAHYLISLCPKIKSMGDNIEQSSIEKFALAMQNCSKKIINECDVKNNKKACNLKSLTTQLGKKSLNRKLAGRKSKATHKNHIKINHHQINHIKVTH